MSYSALFLADLHLSNTLPYAARDTYAISDRVNDGLAVLEQVAEYAEEHSIRDVWILGDLLDKRLLDAVTLKLALPALSKLASRCELRIVPGNHEASDASCRHFTLDMLKPEIIGLKDLINADHADRSGGFVHVQDGPTFCALPYASRERTELALKRALEADYAPPPLLLHQTIQGARQGAWESPEGLSLDLLAEFPSVLAGHFHTPQELKRGDRLIAKYLGAPIQHHFGDAGERRGFWHVTFNEDGTFGETKMIRAKAPSFHELHWPVETSGRIREEDYVKIVVRSSRSKLAALHAEAEEYAEKLRADRHPRLCKVEPHAMADETTYRLRVIDDGGASRSWSTLLAAYLDVCDVTGAQHDRLLALGQELVREADS